MLSVLSLAAPVALSYLGIMLMGFVDTLVLGRLGAAELGGGGVGNSISSWGMVAGIGLITGMEYPLGLAVGGRKPRDAFHVFLHGNALAWIAGFVVTLALLGVSFGIPHFGFNAEVAPLARSYIRIVAFSMIPVLGFNACRSYLQIQGIAVPTTILLVVSNLLNLALNIGLAWGKWGLPEMGFDGCAWATLVVRIFLYLASLAMVSYYDRKQGHRFFQTEKFRYSRAVMGPILKLGAPGSAQMVLEVGIFSLATALAARFSAEELAAHQSVLTTASLTFMIPLGISSAAATLVGRSVGASAFPLAHAYGWRSLGLGALSMGLSAVLMLLFSDLVLRAYTSDEAVIGIGKSLILIAGLFQLSDGVQVVATGALRGLGETSTAALANLFGHWFIGLPVCIWLGFYTPLKLQGIWIGLATGLTVVAVTLLIAWKRRITHRLSLPATHPVLPETASHL